MKKYILSIIAFLPLSFSSCIEESYEADLNDTIIWGKRHAYEMVDAWASHVNQTMLCDFSSAVALDEMIPSIVGVETGGYLYNLDSTVVVKCMDRNRFRAAMINDVYMTCIETDGKRLSDPSSSWIMYSACDEDFTVRFMGIKPRICNYCFTTSYNFPITISGDGNSWTITQTKQGKLQRHGSWVVKRDRYDKDGWYYVVNGKGQFPVENTGYISETPSSFSEYSAWADYEISNLIWRHVDLTWQSDMSGGSADIEIFGKNVPYTLKPSVSFVDGKIHINYEDISQSYYPSERP